MSLISNYINEEFFLAAKSGHFEKVKLLKARGAQIDCPRLTNNNYTPLHAASENGFTEIVDFLLSSNVQPNCEANWNITPLHLAAEKGHLKIAELLLGHGANVNARSENNSTPLHFACQRDCVEIVEILLKNDADANAALSDGLTPLLIAIDKKSIKLINILLKYDVDINEENSGLTALGFAASGVSPNCIKSILLHTIRGESDDDFNRSCVPRDLLCPFLWSDSCFENVIIKTLKKHVIKLNVAGLYVSGKNLRYLGLDRPENISLCDFKQECEVEVSKMKEQPVYHNITVYDILVNRNNRTYARKKSLRENLWEIDYSEFPVYESLLKRFENIKRISELITPAGQSLNILRRTSNVFNEKKSPRLPTEILEQIVSYLGVRDLEDLIPCGLAIKNQVSK